ncbi:M28 family peptidase [Clostridium sp.]|uniref:M28 family metallopeptidase n=1 Tax=Clostridium sp. TaxID=1506 RepID=UPI0032177E3C
MELIIEKLCSDKFEGRPIGSDGNIAIEEYLNEIFSSIKLDPVIETGFKHSYPYKQGSTFDKEIGKMKSFDITANNVIGKLSGINTNKVIILSAHFDHLRKENDNIYRGAVDNASGIAVLSQLAIQLKKDPLTKPFQYDIVFAAFNGEESGLSGSENFVNKIDNLYDDVININIDSLGYKHGGDIAFFNTYYISNSLNKIEKSNDYINLMNNINLSLDKYGINSIEKDLKVGSDDVNFQRHNYTSISISEENIKEIIHTLNDIPEVIDYTRLENVVYSLQDFIKLNIDNLFVK